MQSGLFLARRLESLVRPRVTPAADLLHALDERQRRVARLRLHGFVAIERVVTRRVRLVIADEAIDLGGRARADEPHPLEPIAERGSDFRGAFDIAVHDDGERAPGQVFRIVPALELDSLRLGRVLAIRARRVGFAAVGAGYTIDHEL